MGKGFKRLTEEEASRVRDELRKAQGENKATGVDRATGGFLGAVSPKELDPDTTTSVSKFQRAYA